LKGFFDELALFDFVEGEGADSGAGGFSASGVDEVFVNQ